MEIINYKLQKDPKTHEVIGIEGLREGISSMAIPMTEENKHYRKYLAWVAEGNTPEPADE